MYLQARVPEGDKQNFNFLSKRKTEEQIGASAKFLNRKKHYIVARRKWTKNCALKPVGFQFNVDFPNAAKGQFLKETLRELKSDQIKLNTVHQNINWNWKT